MNFPEKGKFIVPTFTSYSPITGTVPKPAVVGLAPKLRDSEKSKIAGQPLFSSTRPYMLINILMPKKAH